MGSIVYVRYVFGEGLRVIEGYMDAILGVKGPSIWRRTCAQAIYIEGNHIKTTDGKTHVLVADSTGITGKGKWIELKCNFIKMHILADEESQKTLAFRRHRRCQEPVWYVRWGPRAAGRATGGSQYGASCVSR